MEAFGYSDLNDLFDRLIIEQFERRHGKILLDEPATDPLVLNEKSRRKHKGGSTYS